MKSFEVGDYLIPRWLVFVFINVVLLVFYWLGAWFMASSQNKPLPMGWSLIEPPAQFDHAYAGEHSIMYVPERETRATCGGIGCSWVFPNKCASIISTDSVIPPGLILRHEIGHCNGWSAAHEGGHLVRAD